MTLSTNPAEIVTRYLLGLSGDWYKNSLIPVTPSSLTLSIFQPLNKDPYSSRVGTLQERTEEIKKTVPLSHFSASSLSMNEEAKKLAQAELNNEDYEKKAKEGTRLPG